MKSDGSHRGEQKGGGRKYAFCEAPHCAQTAEGHWRCAGTLSYICEKKKKLAKKRAECLVLSPANDPGNRTRDRSCKEPREGVRGSVVREDLPTWVRVIRRASEEEAQEEEEEKETRNFSGKPCYYASQSLVTTCFYVNVGLI